MPNTGSQNNPFNDDENLILPSDLPFSVAEEEIDSHPVSQNFILQSDLPFSVAEEEIDSHPVSQSLNTDEEPVPQYTTRTGRVITKPARYQ